MCSQNKGAFACADPATPGTTLPQVREGPAAAVKSAIEQRRGDDDPKRNHGLGLHTATDHEQTSNPAQQCQTSKKHFRTPSSEGPEIARPAAKPTMAPQKWLSQSVAAMPPLSPLSRRSAARRITLKAQYQLVDSDTVGSPCGGTRSQPTKQTPSIPAHQPGRQRNILCFCRSHRRASCASGAAKVSARPPKLAEEPATATANAPVPYTHADAPRLSAWSAMAATSDRAQALYSGSASIRRRKHSQLTMHASAPVPTKAATHRPAPTLRSAAAPRRSRGMTSLAVWDAVSCRKEEVTGVQLCSRFL